MANQMCNVPGCVLLRVNTRQQPMDTIGVHIHPDSEKPEALPNLLGAAIAQVLQDKRLSV